MISYKFTIQEIIAILMDSHDVSNEFLFWITYKHYPVLNWIRKDLYFLYVSQNFNTTSYGKWWIPRIRLISKHFSLRYIFQVLLSRQPIFLPIFQPNKYDWIIIDNQQTGKYVPQNYLYIFYVIIFH